MMTLQASISCLLLYSHPVLLPDLYQSTWQDQHMVITTLNIHVNRMATLGGVGIQETAGAECTVFCGRQ